MKKGFEQGHIFCRLCAAIALLFFLLSGCWSTERKEASSGSANVVQSQSFISAKPIWPAGRDREMNLFVGFRAAFKKPVGGKTVLRITGSTVYRIFLNGNFVGYGPARAAHGYYRVDEWGLGDLGNENIVAVEVAGYNVNSYYLLDQPAFVQAEVVANGQVLASTAGKGAFFEASILKERVQKVQRYSFQRPFSEYYRLGEGFDQWRRERTAHFEKEIGRAHV